MSNKTTILRNHHHEFLDAQRQDPITHKVFAVGDRVTVCVACLVPFLKESWDAIGGTHCGQSATTGLEAFETTMETPSAEDGPTSADVKIGNRDTGQPVAMSDMTAPALNPLPINLHEVPIKLR